MGKTKSIRLLESSIRSNVVILFLNSIGRVLRYRYTDVRCFCVFIGHTRSGHSFLGSVLDAHPDVKISTEANALLLAADGRYSRDGLFFLIDVWSFFFARFLGSKSAGYSYKIENQYQGRSKRMLVLGDNRGRGTYNFLARNQSSLEMIKNKLGIPIRFIYVIRNPFDMLTTQFLKRKQRIPEITDDFISKKTEDFKKESAGILAMISKERLDCHLIYQEKFIQAPSLVLESLCRFLEIDQLPVFYASVEAKIFKKPKMTRSNFAWSKSNIEDLESYLMSIEYLRPYSFKGQNTSKMKIGKELINLL